MDNEGVGLFALQAMLNHDCEPNAQIKFKHDTDMLSVETTRDIEKGEEVCIRFVLSSKVNSFWLVLEFSFLCKKKVQKFGSI